MPKKPAASQETADQENAGEAADADQALDFEAALAELEALVDQMEAGDMTLEASLTAFERGVKLTRRCQAALRDAELKVKRLTQDNELEPLDPDEFDDH
ncbi:MAG: exodeoxyribonuclease VII small subunit [Gammaproteobacteria bacterium]|nr:exodeoxyribonuclease VII small subunit [Gammaproteobacteria bacterium]